MWWWNLPRMNGHRNDLTKNLKRLLPVSQHFVPPGHSLDDFGRSKIYNTPFLSSYYGTLVRVAIGDSTESLTLVSDPKSCRFIRWILFQMFIYIWSGCGRVVIKFWYNNIIFADNHELYIPLHPFRSTCIYIYI
jgi:hypothetical protein